MIRMPGKSYHGPLGPLNEEQLALRAALKGDIEKLAGEIGPRSLWQYNSFKAAAAFVGASLQQAGFEVRRQQYKVEGFDCWNLEVEIPGSGKPDEIVVVGAHYDTVYDTPGANDNGSGVAALLALARKFADRKPQRTLRLVAFATEEPPYFQTHQMGSLFYARRCRQRSENIVAMLSLETIGYYSDEENSQSYPWPFSVFYPGKGNFVAFVGNYSSRSLVRQVVKSFRQQVKFPCEGAALPSVIPGVGWSDHESFWRFDYPALMVTDTAPFRYRHYHQPSDTPDKISYDQLTLVVDGLAQVIAELLE